MSESHLETFDFERAESVISKAFPKDKENKIRLLLSKLRRAGWITVMLDERDNRFRVYRLKQVRDVYKEIAQEIINKPKQR